MADQPQLLFEDAESVTRRKVLNVVHARAESVADFGADYFAGFDAFRGLTYTSSMPMIAALLRDHDFRDFECIFGHGGILSRETADVLAFQAVVRGDLERRILRLKGVTDERRQALYDRIADGSVRFRVVKDAIAHAKIYLLSGGPAGVDTEDSGSSAATARRRVIAGSANLSERAFSGRQAETLIVFDQDNLAWDHYVAQYEAVRDASTSRVPISPDPAPAEQVHVERTPALVEAGEKPEGTTLYLPAQGLEEAEASYPSVVARMEAIKPAIRRGMAGASRPDRRGNLRLTPRIVREIVRVVRSRDAEAGPPTYLARTGDAFTLSDAPYPLEADPKAVRGDVAAWLAFFDNYEHGFVGDVPRLQRDYFTFMCWFYFAPLMCDLRNAALRSNAFSFDQPLFAVLYGSSNCGKTSLVEALMASMFGHPRIVDTQDFTPGRLRGLQQSYKRFPVVFDDVTRDRFNRYADEIVKDETIPFAEYPCFALSMNADARSFKSEIVKRCLMIYTRTALPGDNTAARRRLQRSVATIRERMGTSLYREYLGRMLTELDAGEAVDATESLAAADDPDATDALLLSSSVLSALFRENLPPDRELPGWCTTMTLAEYQQRAFERPRRLLAALLSPERYSPERRPPEQCWTVAGENVLVAVAPIEFSRTRADIPDWLLDDTASASGQVALNRKLTEDFLGIPVRRPRRWRWWRR
ncbi:MAG: hypothetical protein OXP09_05820 [Gammaproteobacteria bacterium]|nr:hypothetical protein [Gammaproteobacteria bacterium]MDE0365076.1 hypothetical protein [Gammaproteobacteria bacterium]